MHPCEANFPGFKNLEEDLKGWQWTFAKSPKFTLISGAQEVHLFHLHLTVSPYAHSRNHLTQLIHQVQVAAGKVVATRHVLQKGVPDIVGHKFDAELADLLEGSYKTRVLASNLRKIT